MEPTVIILSGVHAAPQQQWLLGQDKLPWDLFWVHLYDQWKNNKFEL